ncbi:MAG: CpsD/CapB family tyrosine-protein kinase [Myxococcota bacterium]|nr:CpsD/CapB family tyrosine-protein kinase [Myxococcota bacterium]
MGKITEALKQAEEQRAQLEDSAGAPSFRDPLTRQVEESGSRAMGRSIRDARRTRVVVSEAERGVAEHYRALRARLESIRRTRPFRSVVLMSARSDEGKTTTAVNLALSYGLGLDADTCLVDADLRTPEVQQSLPEQGTAGLTEVLEDRATLDEALVRFPDTRLWVLAARSVPRGPSELLASQRMVEVMRELHSRFGIVIVDGLPILGLPDMTTLVDVCDVALLVVASKKSARPELERALGRVDREKVIGIVFNRSEDGPVPYDYVYGLTPDR